MTAEQQDQDLAGDERIEEPTGLRATLAVEFVERDGELFMVFEAGMDTRLIEASVGRISPADGEQGPDDQP